MKPHDLQVTALDEPATLTTKVRARCLKCGIRHTEEINMNVFGTHDELIEMAKAQAVKHLHDEWTDDCDEAARLRQVRAVHDS